MKILMVSILSCLLCWFQEPGGNRQSSSKLVDRAETICMTLDAKGKSRGLYHICLARSVSGDIDGATRAYEAFFEMPEEHQVLSQFIDKAFSKCVTVLIEDGQFDQAVALAESKSGSLADAMNLKILSEIAHRPSKERIESGKSLLNKWSPDRGDFADAGKPLQEFFVCLLRQDDSEAFNLAIKYSSEWNRIELVIAYLDERFQDRTKGPFDFTFPKYVKDRRHLLFRFAGHLANEGKFDFAMKVAAFVAQEDPVNIKSYMFIARIAEQSNDPNVQRLAGMAIENAYRSLESVPLGKRNLRFAATHAKVAIAADQFDKAFDLMIEVKRLDDYEAKATTRSVQNAFVQRLASTTAKNAAAENTPAEQETQAFDCLDNFPIDVPFTKSFPTAIDEQLESGEAGNLRVARQLVRRYVDGLEAINKSAEQRIRLYSPRTVDYLSRCGFDERAKRVAEAIKCEKDKTKAWGFIVRDAMQQKRYIEAMEILDRRPECVQKNSTSLIAVLCRNDRQDLVTDILDYAESDASKHLLVWQAARALIRDDQFQPALQLMEAHTVESRLSSQNYHQLADALHPDRTRRLVLLEKFVSMFPEWKGARCQLSFHLAREGRSEEAFKVIEPICGSWDGSKYAGLYDNLNKGGNLSDVWKSGSDVHRAAAYWYLIPGWVDSNKGDLARKEIETLPDEDQVPLLCRLAIKLQDQQ